MEDFINQLWGTETYRVPVRFLIFLSALCLLNIASFTFWKLRPATVLQKWLVHLVSVVVVGLIFLPVLLGNPPPVQAAIVWGLIAVVVAGLLIANAIVLVFPDVKTVAVATWKLRPATVLQDHSVIVACAAAGGAGLLSWLRGNPPPAQAAIAGFLIAAAMVLAFRFVRAIEKDPVALRMTTGGLGDGIGNFELTKPAALLLFTLIFTGLAFWVVTATDARPVPSVAGVGTAAEKNEKK
jgi:hypothetical protein